MRRLRAVIVKEFAHILRDPRSLSIVFVMPLFMIFIYGYAISFDLDRITAAVIDHSQTELSARLVNALAHNKYYDLTELRTIPSEPGPLARGEEALRRGRFKELVVIPADFARNLRTGRPTELGVIIDGSDSNIASRLYQYNQLIFQDFMLDLVGERDLLRVGTQIYFNPESRSAFFFVPGLVAVLLLMVSAMLTSISIAKERERGSIDLLFISPLRSGEIIVGKTVPYVLVAFVTGSLILAFARVWFGVPFRGNVLILALFALFYVLTGLSFGILISSTAPTQRVAMIAAMLTTLLPSVMLSGFIFPVESLSPVLRFVTRVVPATYFLRIIRGVVLKGAGVGTYLTDGLILLGFSAVFLALASLRFSRLRRSVR
jgi:ABC-2 type transport system permease protein